MDMKQALSFIKSFFSFKGRLNQKEFIVRALILGLFLILFRMLGRFELVTFNEPTTVVIISPIVILVLIAYLSIIVQMMPYFKINKWIGVLIWIAIWFFTSNFFESPFPGGFAVLILGFIPERFKDNKVSLIKKKKGR